MDKDIITVKAQHVAIDTLPQDSVNGSFLWSLSTYLYLEHFCHRIIIIFVYLSPYQIMNSLKAKTVYLH